MLGPYRPFFAHLPDRKARQDQKQNDHPPFGQGGDVLPRGPLIPHGTPFTGVDPGITELVPGGAGTGVGAVDGRAAGQHGQVTRARGTAVRIRA
jgi:hypothetical protein